MRRSEDLVGRFFLGVWHQWEEFDLPVWPLLLPHWLHFCLRLDPASNVITVTMANNVTIGRVAGRGKDLEWLAATQMTSLQANNEGLALVNIFSNKHQARYDS
jgi:hypothetical protein